MQTFSMHIKGR